MKKNRLKAWIWTALVMWWVMPFGLAVLYFKDYFLGVVEAGERMFDDFGRKNK